MTPEYPLTIWMNMPSFYQEDLFQRLSADPCVDLDVIYAHGLEEHRRQLGWRAGLSGYRYRILPRHRRVLSAATKAWQRRRRIHIVNGIWSDPAFTAAILVLLVARSKVIVYSEAPRGEIVRSELKRRIRDALGRFVARRASGVLAVSRFAVQYYKELGFDPERRICPFAYFRAYSDSAIEGTRAHSMQTRRYEVVFAGALIPRKQPALLLSAMAGVMKRFPDIHLTFIGEGDCLASLRRQAADAGVKDRVTFEGVIPYDTIQRRLSKADVLVLPSIWDGWGLVINEALAAGTPVIVSDRCGAADVIRDGVNGFTFRADDRQDLENVLEFFFTHRERHLEWRAAAALSATSLDIDVAVDYLKRCIKFLVVPRVPKPAPPWLTASPLEAVRVSNT